MYDLFWICNLFFVGILIFKRKYDLNIIILNCIFFDICLFVSYWNGIWNFKLFENFKIDCFLDVCIVSFY